MSEKILLGHGSGGKLMHELLRKYFLPLFSIKEATDAAVLEKINGRLAFTTDSYVVTPLFFPGGDIGDLAVNGTVNDLAMMGAIPLYLTAGFIIEEGFPVEDLKKILSSMSRAAESAGIKIVAGDTKVVEKGKADGLFINTSGVGIVPDGIEIGPKYIKPGDRVIISGPVGNHGISIISKRNGLSFDPPLHSDTKPLAPLVKRLINESINIHAMRDPTRGGLATTLKEIALETGLSIEIEEGKIPVLPQVKGACDILGLDPLYVANEGVMVIFVQEEDAEMTLNILKNSGEYLASIIGTVKDKPPGTVLLKTEIGGTRLIDMLSGEQLPRIC
ncbi:MAG: hydrogenase expression/formation protein HypE [Thermodesulfovibrionales bacterium]|nr:hydrogenase expression/formation protein HypE [Thermodesulfovibrionales bacterium]